MHLDCVAEARLAAGYSLSRHQATEVDCVGQVGITGALNTRASNLSHVNTHKRNHTVAITNIKSLAQTTKDCGVIESCNGFRP